MNLTFLSPLFFIGCAAIALPIIAHLITRKSGVLKSFPTVKFLISSQGDTASKSRIRDLILLLLRALILVFIVLLFTKPAIFSFSAKLDNNPLSLAIVIDNSFSMGFQNNFQSAKNQARDIIDTVTDGSFVLVAPLVIESEVDYQILEDKNELKKALESIKLSNSFTQNESRLQDIYSELQSSPIEDKKIILITDLQKNGWANEKFNLSWLEVIDISKISDPSNHTVSETNLDLENKSVVVSSKISNFSNNSITQLLTTSRLNEREVKELVDVEPQNTVNVEVKFFTDPENSPGIGLVQTTNDDLKIDDTRYYVFDRNSSSKILIIDGDPREDSRLSETYYLRSVLETISENTSTNLTILDNNSLFKEELSGYKMIFMANVGELTPRVANEIEAFVNNGGSVVIFLGNLIRAGSYNSLLKNILPGELQVLSEGNFTISDSNSEIFSKDILSKSAQISIEKLYKTIPSSESETLIYASDNSPLLLGKNYGNGHIFMFTTSADTAWNNFSITPVFLPIIKNLMDIPGIEKNKNRHFIIGEPVNIEVSDGRTDTVVRDPTGNEYQLDSGAIEFLQTYIPGIYTVTTGGQFAYNFAVNINPDESDLRKISISSAIKNERPEKGSVMVYKEIWRYFLWGVIALFVSEAAFRGILS